MALEEGAWIGDYIPETIVQYVTSVSRQHVGLSMQKAEYYRGAALAVEDEFAGKMGPSVGIYDPEETARLIQE